jgi:hypothetical protein
MNGGAVTALFECHGNWTAAVALMDAACLPKPPLSLTKELLVTYKEPTPANTPLVIRSQVVKMNERHTAERKSSVHVELTLHKVEVGGKEKLLATAEGVFKKLGALRAL